MMGPHNEFDLERMAIYVRKFMRQFCLSLGIVIALAGYSLAQQDASGQQDSGAQQDSTSGTRPSAADCLAAVTSGGSVPTGCFQDSSGGGSMRQQQDTTPARVQLPQLTGERPETPERKMWAPVNPSQRPKIELPVWPQTEFEQIVADTVGRALPLFGQSLFAQPPSTFAPTDRAQVPGDYVLGPDDELQIRIWGQINASLHVVVDRSGQIFIPKVGEISVAGIRYRDLEEHLKNEVLKYYRNFSLTANIGRTRSIQVYVVGQARDPGSYTIGSLSTLVNAVFASGGPSPQGSLRDVQVQREGKTIAHLDFYELLVKGDKSKDIRLQSGDVLYFPPVGPLVAMAGSVNTPGIYEVKDGSALGDLIEIAGGLSTAADANKVTVERMGDHQAHSVMEFPLDAQSRALPLNDGDIVRVLSLVPRFHNAVTLRGNVVDPGRYPWKPGMRVRDLIPNAQALLTRPYWMGRAGMTDGRSTEYPIRPEPEGDKAALTSPPSANAASDDRGQSRVGDQSQGNDVPSQLARKNPNSETLTGDLHLASPEINWSYAVIQRVNPVDLSTKLLSFDLGKAVLEGDEANNLALESDDIITIFSQADVAVPQSQRARYVRLEGEVVRAGIYKAEEGELLRDVIRRAGGVTTEAYIYGTELTRESARLEQQKSIDELANSLEVEVHQASASAAIGSSAVDAPMVAAQQKSQQALVERLKNLKATGRVVLNLKPTANSIDAYPKIAVEDNDRIVIPHLPSTVSVVGMVYNSGSFVYDSRRKVGDYLRMAGRGRPHADMRHAFVLRADGTVVPSKSVNGLFEGDRFSSLRLYPGDQIVVPTRIPTGNFVRGLRDWTQISSQLAITGAALAVIQ
jgi:protein involved in polysaccharide export with SLBB domain